MASPVRSFPRVVGPSLLYVTDDWIAGAPLMGLSGSLCPGRARSQPSLRRHCGSGVTRTAGDHHPLWCLLSRPPDERLRRAWLPELQPPETMVVGLSARARSAVLMGQLNERLDLACLEAVSDAGVPVLVIGPRTDREAGFGARLGAWLGRDNVTWLGHRPAADVPQLIAQLSVGLTPYVDSPFNRASFPLKTLEYLAHGLPVVASDLPAVRWLDCPHIDVARRADDFASLAHRRWLSQADELDGRGRAARRDYARRHSWERKAEAMLALLVNGDAPVGVPHSVGE